MENGAPAYLMLSRLLHVAALRCRSQKLSHIFHEGNGSRTVKKKIIIMTNNCLAFVADTPSSKVFNSRRYFFRIPILYLCHSGG